MLSKETSNIILEYIKKYNLEKYQDYIMENSDDVISFDIEKNESLDEDQIKIGISKFGGKPHLPPNLKWPVHYLSEDDNGVSYPTSLNFVGQFNFEEITKIDLETRLPKKGMLYIFVDQGWSDEETTKLLFTTEMDNLKVTEFPINHDTCNFEEISYFIKFKKSIVIPYNLYKDWDDPNKHNDDYNYSNMREKLLKNNIITDAMFLNSESVEMKRDPFTSDTIPLLEFPSYQDIMGSAGFCWAGHMYKFSAWITLEDLEKNNFENCQEVSFDPYDY